MARVLYEGNIFVSAADWDALKCHGDSCCDETLNGARLFSLRPLLASAGYFCKAPIPVPVTNLSTSWACLTNTTGLVVGRTRLGDELSNLYSAEEIAASVFSEKLHWLWNGMNFINREWKKGRAIHH